MMASTRRAKYGSRPSWSRITPSSLSTSWVGARFATHNVRRNLRSGTHNQRHLAVVIHVGIAVDEEAIAKHHHLLGDAELPCGVLPGTVNCSTAYATSQWAIPGLWHWLLAHPSAVRTPIPMRGWLSLWEVDVPSR
jgi:hypothetical protein